MTMDRQFLGPYRKRVKARQACDCCHGRKIRCDASMPCSNCKVNRALCTYLSVPKKSGPNGPRMIRGSRAVTRAAMNGEEGNARSATAMGFNIVGQYGRSVRTDLGFSHGREGFQPSPLITLGVIKSCVKAFFTLKYPIMPILERDEVYATLPELHDSPEKYGLITSLCAVVILQSEVLEPPFDCNAPSSKVFIQETLRARQYCNHVDAPSLISVQTSFFLFAALFCVDKDRSAWFYLREAITLLQVQHLHEEGTYSGLRDKKYASACRRTFWLLFITERAYELQRNHPLTLASTISLPTVDSGPEASVIRGFIDLASLFGNFDDTFISLWDLPPAEPAILPHHFIQLQDVLTLALPDVSQRSEIQQADLLVTRQWLKTIVWQLCVARSFLSSATAHECMSFNYPIAISRGIARIAQLLPHKAFEAHGVGILEKVFDVGCSLVDVLLLHADSIPISAREVGPRDYLVELVKILGTVMGGSSKYLRLLVGKADECLHVQIRMGLVTWERSVGSCKDYRTRDKDRNKRYESEGLNSSLSPLKYPVVLADYPSSDYLFI